MRTANLSLRVGCFDDVDANRLDKRASLEGEGDWEGALASEKEGERERAVRHTCLRMERYMVNGVEGG